MDWTGKSLLILSFILFISCNTKDNKNEDNSKCVNLKKDTILICGKLNNKPIQGSMLIDSGSCINFIDVLNMFQDTSFTGPFKIDSNSIQYEIKISNSIKLIKYFKYNSDYYIYTYSSIGSIYIIRDDFRGEEYFIKYHSALDSTFLDSIVQYLKAAYIKRKQEMFPVIKVN